MKNIVSVVLAIVLALHVSGCATIIFGSHQTVEVSTDPPGATVRVVPSRRRFKTPGSVKLARKKPVTLVIEKEGYLTVETDLEVIDNASAFVPLLMNIIIGGAIGLMMDASSGATLKLSPDVIDMTLEPAPPVTTIEWTLPTETLDTDPVVAQRIARLTKTQLSRDILGTAIEVSAGDSLTGCNEEVDSDCLSNERPSSIRFVESFEIEASEVTVGAYRECVEADRCSEPRAGGACNWARSGRERHPQNCIDWNQANAYCEWKGMRLPTEWEWERAARGDDGRKFPWGNIEMDCDRAVFASHEGSGCGLGDTTFEVGSKPLGRSAYGLLDMAGNVAEWTSSEPDDSALRSVRGGSWFDRPEFARVSLRGRHRVEARLSTVGFRCARRTAVVDH